MDSYQTTLGGMASILLRILLFELTVYNFYLMFSFGSSNIMPNFVATDYDDLGIVNATRLGKSLPYYNFYSKDELIKRNDSKKCAETGGDCFAFLQ